MSNIKTFLDSPAGQELKNYLLAKLAELQNIENIQEYETTAAQALALKAQRRAYLKLKEIVSDLVTFQDVKPKDPKDSYLIV